MWLIYNLLFPIGFLLLSPFYFWKMARRGGWRAGFEQRFGIYDAEFRAKVGKGVDLWIQAVSVGEVGIARAIIAKLQERNPRLRIVLTTTTSTGQAEAQRHFGTKSPAGTPVPPVLISYFPLDWGPITQRAFHLYRPKLFVIVETEIWPNAIRLAKGRGVTVALVNGRISDKSLDRYARLNFFFDPIFQSLDLVLAQSEEEAHRFESLGAACQTTKSVGQIKFDLGTATEYGSVEAWGALERCGVRRDQRIWVCGSTFAGEEEICLRVANKLRKEFSDLFVVLVPRHAERRAEVVELAKRMGVKLAVRSEMNPEGCDPEAAPTLDGLLVDTTGELRGFYETAAVVFIGKSLTAHGGQNPIEPAAAGKAIVVGPNMENFREGMAEFRNAAAVVEVRDEQELEMAIKRLLANGTERKDLGQRAQAVVKANQGSLMRTVEALSQFLTTP